jgi:hypothetical protein
MVGFVDPTKNIWFGGQIDMAASLGTTDLSAMDEYQGLCTDKFYPLFGIGSDPFCSFMGMMRYSRIVTWLLLGVDFFAAVLWFLRYMPAWLKRFWNLITGNKSTVQKVISR